MHIGANNLNNEIEVHIFVEIQTTDNASKMKHFLYDFAAI